MKINKTVVICLFAAILLGASSWVVLSVMRKNYSYVVIEIPDDFTGFIRLTENESKGYQPTLDSEGKLRIQVPDSGTLKLESMNLFFSPFKATALYHGELLRVAPISDHIDGTVLWVLNQPMRREMYFYLGDRDEAIDFLKRNRRDLYTVDGQ